MSNSAEINDFLKNKNIDPSVKNFTHKCMVELCNECGTKKTLVDVQRQSRQLEDIVSALTHDLKTPLIAAQTSYKHLLDGSFGNLTKEQKDVINLLLQSNEDSLRLVNNLLSVFKYETKSYKLLLEITSISDLIEKSIDVIKPIALEKNINIKTIKSNFHFVCDPFELERVIVNILSNAIKYSPSGGKVEIKAVKNQDGEVSIEIEDNGIGIRKEELSNLFERFWQSHKASGNSRNNTGLGLYLSRQIIESHGGVVWAKSTLGAGTILGFKIPNLG